jgi:DNA adenine methylase
MLNLRLDRYADRLKNISLFNQDYRAIISRFDSPSTAFYIDPPYPEEKQKYTHYSGMRPIPAVQDIKSAVDHVHGKVLLSYPNIPSVREAFKPPHWRTQTFRIYRPFSPTNGGPSMRTELLITNYKPEDVRG